MDSTDVPIQQPSPRSKGWYSHKINGAGHQYELAVGIPTGTIVHINGPYPAGHWPDINIYCCTIKGMLLPNEYVVVDLGYHSDKTTLTPQDGIEPQVLDIIQRVRHRHEGINGMLKTFRILRNIFHHDLRKHENCFKVVAIMVQVKLLQGEGSYPVTEYRMTHRPELEHPFAVDRYGLHDIVLEVANGNVLLQLEIGHREVDDDEETVYNIPFVTQED